MSRYDEIQAACRMVVSESASGLGRPVEFRRLTSKSSVNPRVYTDWEDSIGLTTDFRNQEVYDEKRNNWYRITTGKLRCPDDSPFPHLRQGDQVRFYAEDGETYKYFAVTGEPSSGPGTVAYVLSNDTALLQDSDRSGGV